MAASKSKRKASKPQVADRLRILSAIVDQFPVRALYGQVAFTGSVKRFYDLLLRMNLQP